MLIGILLMAWHSVSENISPNKLSIRECLLESIISLTLVHQQSADLGDELQE